MKRGENLEVHRNDQKSDSYNIPIEPNCYGEAAERYTAEETAHTLGKFIESLKSEKEMNQNKINNLSSRNNQLNRRIQALQEVAYTHYINQPRILYFSERKFLQIEGSIGTNEDIFSIINNRIETGLLDPLMAGRIGFIQSVESLSRNKLSEYTGMHRVLEEGMESTIEPAHVFKEGMYAAVYTKSRLLISQYDRLLNYVSKRGYHPEGPFLIHQVVDTFMTSKEDELLSEVRIRVRK